VQEVLEPLFPRYLFIRLDSVNDNWMPIRSTRGVGKIVRFNEHPLPVDDRIVEEIRRRLANNPIKEPYLKPGERVVIIEGSFSNVEAIFSSSDGDQRVILLLNILHSEQNLSFPLQSVRKICP
jgi:transcriptional antiterminator RfaH